MSKEPKKNPYQPQPQPNEIIIQPNGTAQDPDATRLPNSDIATTISRVLDAVGVDKKAVGKAIIQLGMDEVSDHIGVGRRKHVYGKRTAFQQIVDAIRELWWVPVVVFLTGGFSLLLLKLLYKWAGV